MLVISIATRSFLFPLSRAWNQKTSARAIVLKLFKLIFLYAFFFQFAQAEDGAEIGEVEFLAVGDILFERSPVEVSDQPDLVSLLAELSSRRVVRNRYVQKKTLKVLRRPLISSGTMLYSHENGVYWQVASPVSSELVMTKDKVLQRVDGQETVIKASQHPLAFQFSQLLFSLFSGDRQRLEKVFEFRFVEESGVWQIALVPRSADFRSIISSVVLFAVERSRGVEIVQVTIMDAVGETTQIAFAETSEGQSIELTDAEKTYFQ